MIPETPELILSLKKEKVREHRLCITVGHSRQDKTRNVSISLFQSRRKSFAAMQRVLEEEAEQEPEQEVVKKVRRKRRSSRKKNISINSIRRMMSFMSRS